MRLPVPLLILVHVSCGPQSSSGGVSPPIADGSSDALADASTDGGTELLAPPGDAAQSGPVDGITCDATEGTVLHIHAHLAVYVGGEQKLIPADIGIADGCLAWLHTHDTSGVIHIESPVQRTFTLGNFFDVWGQPLSSTRVGPVQGTVIAYVNGQPFTGDPGSIPLDAHDVIQLDVGTPPEPPQPYTFPAGL